MTESIDEYECGSNNNAVSNNWMSLDNNEFTNKILVKIQIEVGVRLQLIYN